MTRYTVTITDGTYVEIHRDQSALDRNRWADFAFRHDLRCIVTESAPKVRGEGTYR